MAILSQTITSLVRGTLVVPSGLATGRATSLTSLLSGLDRVDLAVGKLVLLDALVRLAVLTETVMLCAMSAWEKVGGKLHRVLTGWLVVRHCWMNEVVSLLNLWLLVCSWELW